MFAGEYVQKFEEGMGLLQYKAGRGYYEDRVCWKASVLHTKWLIMHTAMLVCRRLTR